MTVRGIQNVYTKQVHMISVINLALLGEMGEDGGKVGGGDLHLGLNCLDEQRQ